MEARKITIMTTSSQSKKVIMSEAETLGQLKADLRREGVNYDGMDFMEGLSKSKLVSDDSLLPKNITYKGQVTNELVFMLSTENKKIRSGAMSRAEAYAAVKAGNHQDAIARKYGKNFTQVSTFDLVDFLGKVGKKEAPKAAPAPAKPAPVVKAPVKTEPKTEGSNSSALAAVYKLVDILAENGTIEEEDVDAIKGVAAWEGAPTKMESSYTDEEMRGMFR